MSAEVKYRTFRDADAMTRAAADELIGVILAVIGQHDVCTLVLAGGSTPGPLYRRLASIAEMPWERIHLFWGDERCVPLDDPRSNYRMARETLLDQISIPEANIHPIRCNNSPARAARVYEEEIRSWFDDQPPAFDVVLLGMGADGHTASLFPESNALEEKEALAVAVEHVNADPPVPRITLTLPLLNASRSVNFLVSGAEKRKTLEAISMGEPRETLPASLIQGQGRTTWFVSVS